MSETLRDLVVSLSLNSDNFTRNIKSIQRQIQEAESAFKLASAGVDNFEQTTQGLATHLTTLERKLSLQKDAVSQYEKALQSASAKLQECYDRQNDYAQRLEDAKQKQAQLKQEVASAATAYKTYKASLGEADSATIAAKANLDAVKVEYRESVAEVRKLEGQNVALKKSAQNAADAFSAAQTKLNGAKAAVKETGSEIEKTTSALELSRTQWDAAGQTIVQSGQAIASIGKQMQNAESRFRLAAAGIKDFDKSAEGLSAKLTLLNEKLVLQNRSVEQYERALSAAKEQLQAAQAVNDPEKIRQATDAVQDAETKLNNARAAVKQTQADIAACNRELKTAASQWTAAGKSMESFGKKCDTASKTMTKVGRTLTTTMTTPILALGAAAIKASISYESAFTSVRKTVDATDAEFAVLSGDIKEMSTQVASSADDIAEVVAVAGQLGIQNSHLMEFARTMIDLGNSTDIVADEAASTLAKFANIMNMDQSLFQNLGSTLVDLGNNYATTESAIMEMAMRLAGAGHQVGLSEAQILGFATALSSVGIEAQMGGSAFSKALVKMEVASATGGQALEDFGKVAGMSAEQFKSLWDRDPAAAFQAFIVGLSKMDEAGLSAIAVLEEIGIKEVRLRDTLLRATNATELFSNTQKTANAAWQENTALTVEAEKRYATTASQLTNLKNKTLLFAQQIGNDLNPTIRKLIDGAGDLVDRFMALDESERKQLITTAARIAAIGPVLLVLGKVTKGIGTLSTGIGKFALAVGKAGGGWKGFFTTLGKSPAVWMAVAAAVVTATVAIADYVSGAKAARDAINGMNDAASALKHSDFKTMYELGSGDALGRFGITFDSAEQAEQTATETKTWLDTLVKEWSDARVETSSTIKTYVASFTAASDEVRAAIQKRRDALSGTGTLGDAADASMTKDIEQLAAWDKEIEQLFIKRREYFLSAADKARLDEIITLRAQLKIQYATTDSDAYDQILAGIENEKARAAAVNETVKIDLYADALTAAADVQKNYLDTLNAEYDTRRNTIQLMTDEQKRTAAQGELDAWYAANRLSQAKDYQKALQKIGREAYSADGIQASIASIGELYSLMQGFDGSVSSLEAIQKWMDGMDGGGLASVLTLMTQLKDANLGEVDLGFEPTALLSQWQSISNIVSAYPEQLKGLGQVVNDTVPEKANEVLVNLNLDTAAEQWTKFTEGTATFTATPTLDGLPESVTIDGSVTLKPLDQWRVTLWKSLNAPKLELTSTVSTTVGLSFGNDWQSELNALWQEKKLEIYGANGLPIDVTPAVIKALTVNDIVVGLSEDGTYHVIVKPSWEGATAEDAKQAVEALSDVGQSNNGLFGTWLLATDTLDALKRANEYYQQYAEMGWRGLLPELGLMTHETLQWANNIITPEMASQIADAMATINGAIANGEAIDTGTIDFVYNLADAIDYISQYGQNEDIVSGILQNLSALGVEMDAEGLSAYLRSLVETTKEANEAQEAISKASEEASNGSNAGKD